MDALRRLFGKGSPPSDATEPSAPSAAAPTRSSSDDEVAYERDLLKGEAARLDDLQQRQLRYADYAWQPPAQGGTRRADDAPGTRDEDPDDG